MEIQLPFILFLSLVTLIMIRQWRKPKTGKLPPGPAKLPVIGNMHHLVGAGHAHVVLRDLAKKYGKELMHIQLGELSTLVVSSAEMAKEFLRTHDVAFAERPAFEAGDIMFYGRSDMVFCPYGDYWRQMRKVCMLELLSTKTVRSFASIRRHETRRLLDRVRSSSGRPINIHDEVSLFTSSIVCRAAFGKIINGRDEFIQIINKISSLSSGFSMTDMFPSWKIVRSLSGEKSRMRKIHLKADEIMGNIIKEHRQNLESGKDGNEDMVDVLLRLKDSGTLPVPITDDNIKSIITDLFAAGTDTSATTTICSLVEMMKKPEVLAKAQAEVRRVFKSLAAGKDEMMVLEEENAVQQLPYLNSVMKEALRLHPPGSLIIRQCREERVVGGYTIAPNTKVLMNLWAMGRDPQYWEEPESFMPERFENSAIDVMGNQFEYLPFGSGRRICPGIAFGTANVLFPLAHLLYYFDWELPPGTTPHSLKLTEMAGLIIGVKNDIFLIPTPHASCS